VIRGWRNDPRWVELYAKREAERERKQYYILYQAQEMDIARRTLNYRIEKVRSGGSPWKY